MVRHSEKFEGDVLYKEKEKCSRILGVHGRRKRGQRGLGPPWPTWMLKILARKSCLLSFEWEKTDFTTFGPPPRICQEKPPSPARDKTLYFLVEERGNPNEM